jgi:hypothetical protein
MSVGDRGRLERILIVAIFLEFLALIAIRLYAIPVHVPWSYNEGWNAYLAQTATAGGVLYPPFDSMVTNNYPPLSFYIVGAIGRAVGDNIVAGRLVEMLSLLTVAVSVFKLNCWLGADRKLALLGSGVFLLGVYAVMPGYIAIDDPQFLAHGFVVAGALAFLYASETRLWRGMLLSALLMALGGLIKHSEISLPLALCSWAAFYDRRRLAVFVISALLVGAVAAVSAYFAWGQAMMEAMFFTPRMTRLSRAVARLIQDLPFMPAYIILTIIAFVLIGRSREASFVLLYLAISLMIGFWMLSGFGVSQNVMFDAVIALSLGGTLFVRAMVEHASRSFWKSEQGRVLVVLLAAAPCMGAGMYVYLSNGFFEQLKHISSAPRWEALYARLGSAQGPVACETLAVCYWARKPLEIDFFNYGQKIYGAKIYANEPDGFLAKVGHKSYAYVVVESNSLPNPLLPRPLMGALFDNYEPVDWVKKQQLVLAPKR